MNGPQIFTMCPIKTLSWKKIHHYIDQRVLSDEENFPHYCNSHNFILGHAVMGLKFGPGKNLMWFLDIADSINRHLQCSLFACYGQILSIPNIFRDMFENGKKILKNQNNSLHQTPNQEEECICVFCNVCHEKFSYS